MKKKHMCTKHVGGEVGRERERGKHQFSRQSHQICKQRAAALSPDISYGLSFFS
jgi:hypothetical protein